MNRILIAVIFCLFLYITASTQVISSSGLTVSVLDSARRVPLPAAHVIVVSGNDTIYLATNERGYVNYSKPLKDSVKLTVSHLGYKPFQAVIKTRILPVNINVYLVERPYDLAEIVVVNDAVAVITKDDTVQFNASAFKTFEGDPMSKLFELLPGMKLEDGILTYLGETIHRVTIDGKRLFGDNVILSLENINTDDVVRVRVYDEASDWDKLNKIKNPELQRVADVTTKSKPPIVRNTTLKTGVGAGTERENREPLYDISGRRVYSRIGETLTANAGIRNIPDYRSRKLKQISGGFSYLYNEANKYIFSTKNEANSIQNAAEGWTNRDYLPTDDYLSRSYNARNSSDNRKYDFSSQNQIRYTFRNKSTIEHFNTFSYISDLRESADIISAIQEGLLTQSRNMTQRESNKSFSYHGRLLYRKSFNSKIQVHTLVVVDISENNGDGWRIDTLSSSTSRIYFENNGDGRKRNYSGGATVIFPLTATLSLEVSDEVLYIDSRSRRTAVDMLTGVTDIINSYDYRIHEVNNGVKAMITYRDNQKQKGVTNASADIKWSRNYMQRDEHFPREYEFPRRFDLITVTSSLKYTFSTFNELQLTYMHWEFPVSIPDLREFLDDSNPLMLRAGNPHLKQPAPNQVEITGNFIKGASAYEFSVQCRMEENTIVDKPHYFPEDTYLPGYDYTASAGSTLITKENLNGKRSFNIKGNYSVRSEKLKSIIGIGLFYGYDRIPGYVNKHRITTIGNSYSASLSIGGNFSSAFTPSLVSKTSYINRYNGYVSNKGLSQTLDFDVRSRMARSIEVSLSNSFRWSVQRPDVPDMDRFGIVSNLSLGYMFGKKKNFTLQAEGNDLFNRKQRIFVDTYEDYISTSYTYRIGRHIMLRAEYKF